LLYFFFSSRRRHTRFSRDWSSDVCSSDLYRSREYNLYLTLSNDKLKLKDFDSDRNQFEKQKEIELQKFIYGFSENEYLKLLEDRSEERRVGKESRSRWWTDEERKKSDTR